MAKILIGCRLPHGLTLQHPDPEKRNISVKLEGLNSSQIVGATYVATEVDADFWEIWKKAYSEFGALKSGAIFEASSANVAKDKAKELKNERTGFEPMAKNAPGIKPADKE